jgi:hypothetical protein
MANYDAWGHHLLRRARFIPENRIASPKAKELAEFTGLIAQDIDALSLFSAQKKLIIVARLPDFFANCYADKIVAGTAFPKHGSIKEKARNYGTITKKGVLFVSDNDFMCAHQLDVSRDKYIPIESDWDGDRPLLAGKETEILGVS